MSTPRPNPHDVTSPSTTRTVHADDVLSFLGRGLPLALFVALLAAGAAFLAARNSPPVYRAEAALLAADPTSGATDGNVVAPTRVAPDVYREALLEGPVVANALERVEGERPGEAALEDFLRRVEVEVDDQEVSGIVRVGVEDRDPAHAALLANTIAEELVDWDRGRARSAYAGGVGAIEREIERIDTELQAGDLSGDRRTALLALRNQRVQELGSARAGGDAMVVVSRLAPLQVAAPPERAIGPRLVFDTFVAFVVGAVAAYVFLFVRGALDRRVRGREDLEAAAAGLPVLAEFPRRGRGADRLADEAAGFFRANLAPVAGREGPRVLAITSPREPAEKDGVAVALAESFARAGRRTLLVDGDLRRPGAMEGLDVRTKGSAPFEAHLETPDRRFAPATVAIGGKGTFDYVPSYATPSHPAELLGRGLPELIARWADAYDVVIVESSPVTPFADTLTTAAHATGVVLCARAGETRREAVEESLASLRRVDARVLGTVLTHVPVPRDLRRLSAAGERATAKAERGESYRTLGRSSERPTAGAAERR